MTRSKIDMLLNQLKSAMIK